MGTTMSLIPTGSNSIRYPGYFTHKPQAKENPHLVLTHDISKRQNITFRYQHIRADQFQQKVPHLNERILRSHDTQRLQLMRPSRKRREGPTGGQTLLMAAEKQYRDQGRAIVAPAGQRFEGPRSKR